jgi:peptidoglycan-associated lipoprotein
MSMKKYVLVLGAALLMAGCGSSVKLDDVPVEDRSGASVAGADSNAAGKNGVTSVDLDKSKLGTAPAGPRIVYFDYDSYVVKPEFQSVVEAHARHIKADKNRKVAIEGHTDERGGREYNLALGQKRAEAVRRALGLLGVADSQVEAVSFGKEKPAVQGGDEAAWSKNRLAEISYR